MAGDNFLLNPDSLFRKVAAAILAPPPLIDLEAWAARNVRFGEESPFPGPFDPERFPFYRRVLEVLSPAHPARVVVLRSSAQIGKTVIGEIFLGATQDLDPAPFMVTHPNENNAHRWVRGKWWPMIRNTPALAAIYESRGSKEGGASLSMQERRDGRGLLIISGANSAAALSQVSVRRQMQDDLSKWATLPEGDPERLADDRSKAFTDAKIFKTSTPHLEHSCRISEAWKRGTQEHYHVPCPHCGFYQRLDWNDFKVRIEADPADIFFVCEACGGIIEERDRYQMIRRGRWVADNPGAEIVSFSLWAAYAGLESWSTIAKTWLQARGDPAEEQAVDNTTGGVPYVVPGDAPAWEGIKERADAAGRPRGIVPRSACLLTLSLDVQDDYLDGLVIGWGSDLRRWIIERIRVEGSIKTPEARAELNRLVAEAWPTEAGPAREVDVTGIDAGAWTDEVFDWARHFPKSRVVMLRGVAGENQPSLALVRRERKRDGTLVKYQGRFFNVGVAGLKGSLYKQLRIVEPGRGYVDFPAGLENSFYEELTAEKRVSEIDRKGFAVWVWTKPRNARNEMLDCAVYGEALAIKLGWRLKSAKDWESLEQRLAGMPRAPLPSVRPGEPVILPEQIAPQTPATIAAIPAPGRAGWRFA